MLESGDQIMADKGFFCRVGLSLGILYLSIYFD
jgi:hypothetical protein